MYTAQDVVYYLLSSTGGGAQDGEHSAIRQAVLHGVREVMQCRNWKWHVRNSSFFVKPVTAGVAYFDQGSTQVILSNATGRNIPFEVGARVYFDWPSEAQKSALSQPFPETATFASWGIGSDMVDIALSTPSLRGFYSAGTAPPGAPAAGDTGMTICQKTSRFLLPEEIKDIDALVSHTAGTLHSYITPEEWLRIDVNLAGTAEPYHYTIMRSDRVPNRWEVRFAGVPTQGLEFHYTYRYIPEPIRYMGYEQLSRTGTATVTAGSRSITITPALESVVDLVGRAIRFGTESDFPEPVGSPRPYLRERRIVRVSANKPEVDENLAPRTNVKYCITDILDCSPSMYTAILSACEMWYARIAGKPSADAMAVFNRDLRIAMENDTLSPLSGRLTTHYTRTPRSMGWHATLLPDIE